MRIQVVVSVAERDEFRRIAERSGKSLSAWIREAARTKAREQAGEPRLRTVADLDAFFAECDARRGEGREPDWEDQKKLILASQLSGMDPDV